MEDPYFLISKLTTKLQESKQYTGLRTDIQTKGLKQPTNSAHFSSTYTKIGMITEEINMAPVHV